MKKIHTYALVVMAAALLLASPASVSANDYQRGNSDNPARLLAYPAHAVGTALEWGVMRPIHWLVSRPNARIFFGHTVNPDDVYFEWRDYR